MTTTDPLAPLVDLALVPEAVDRARQACEQLRWHEAFRRRAREVRAEATLHSARESAAIDGARLTMPRVRALAAEPTSPVELATDPAEAAVCGALRAEAYVESLVPPLGTRATAQLPPLAELLARLHTLATADWFAPELVGRPRTSPPRDLAGLGAAPPPDEVADRLALLADVLARTSAPALVVAAVVHGELLALRPFAAANGVVARAVARLLVATRGLDPTASTIPETAWSARPNVYLSAAAGFATGTPDGVARWVASSADALVTGADRARALADAVLAGTLPRD